MKKSFRCDLMAIKVAQAYRALYVTSVNSPVIDFSFHESVNGGWPQLVRHVRVVGTPASTLMTDPVT